MKQCNKCQEWKEINEFYKNSNVKSGYFNQCKKCHNGNGMSWGKMTKEQKAMKEAELTKYATEYCNRHPNAKDSLIKWIIDGSLKRRDNTWDKIREQMNLCVG